MNDQQDALCRLAKLRELHSRYRQCEVNESIVRANLVELVQKRREAKHALDDYMDAESKPLPLFDNLPRPEGPPAVILDTIEKELPALPDLETERELDVEEDDSERLPDEKESPLRGEPIGPLDLEPWELDEANIDNKFSWTGKRSTKPAVVRAAKVNGRLWVCFAGFTGPQGRQWNILPLYAPEKYVIPHGEKWPIRLVPGTDTTDPNRFTGVRVKVGTAEYIIGPADKRRLLCLQAEPDPAPIVPDMEAVLEAEADLDAEEALDPAKNPATEDIQVEVCPGVSFVLYLFPDGSATGRAPLSFGNWNQENPSVYWPADRIVSGTASLAAHRALYLADHEFFKEKGGIDLYFNKKPTENRCGIEPEPQDDRTAFHELRYLRDRLAFKKELVVDTRLRLELCSWRKREAEGDIEPRWDRWSEFEVTYQPDPRPGLVFQCLLRTDMPLLILDVWGEGLEGGYHSFPVGKPQALPPAEWVEKQLEEMFAPPHRTKKKGRRS